MNSTGSAFCKSSDILRHIGPASDQGSPFVRSVKFDPLVISKVVIPFLVANSRACYFHCRVSPHPTKKLVPPLAAPAPLSTAMLRILK